MYYLVGTLFCTLFLGNFFRTLFRTLFCVVQAQSSDFLMFAQVHYNNPELKSGIVDSSGIK